MPKSFLRIIAILLVPCLVVGELQGAAVPRPFHWEQKAGTASSFLFTQEALSLAQISNRRYMRLGTLVGNMVKIVGKKESVSKSETDAVMILSGHKSEDEGKWVAEQISQVIELIPHDRPLVFWFERASPKLPLTVDGLEELIGPKGWLRGVDLQKGLVKDPLDATVRRIIHKLFEAVYPQWKAQILGALRRTSNPFETEIWKTIRQLEADKRPVTAAVEDPQFDAYLENLIADSHHVAAIEQLESGKFESANQLFLAYYRHKHRGNSVRDDIGASSLAQNIASYPPGAFHVIIRGTAHLETLKAGLEKRGLSLMTPRIHPIIPAIIQHLMNQGYDAGKHGAVYGELLSTCLILLVDPTVQRSAISYTQTILRDVLSDSIADWFKYLSSLKFERAEQMTERTFAWLQDNAHRLSQESLQNLQALMYLSKGRLPVIQTAAPADSISSPLEKGALISVAVPLADSPPAAAAKRKTGYKNFLPAIIVGLMAGVIAKTFWIHPVFSKVADLNSIHGPLEYSGIAGPTGWSLGFVVLALITMAFIARPAIWLDFLLSLLEKLSQFFSKQMRAQINSRSLPEVTWAWRRPYFAWIAGVLALGVFSFGYSNGLSHLQMILLIVIAGMFFTEASISYDKIMWAKGTTRFSFFLLWVMDLVRKSRYGQAQMEDLNRKAADLLRRREAEGWSQKETQQHFLELVAKSHGGKLLMFSTEYSTRKMDWSQITEFILLGIVILLTVFVLGPYEFGYTPEYLVIKSLMTVAGVGVVGRALLQIGWPSTRRQVIRWAMILVTASGVAALWTFPAIDHWLIHLFRLSGTLAWIPLLRHDNLSSENRWSNAAA